MHAQGFAMPSALSPSCALRRGATPLTGAATDYDGLLELARKARVVCIGEASHGTHDFYRVRGELTKRLITEAGFNAIAAEADWPDAYRLHRWVYGRGDDADAEEALRDFLRFPQWMWRNADVLDFAGWLRNHNDALPEEQKVGFYGLDLYSLHASIDAVLGYLQEADPAAAERARNRYACFDVTSEPERYGYLASLGLSRSCEAEAVAQLVDLQRRTTTAFERGALLEIDEAFFAEQNARVVMNAEEYYRSSLGDSVTSWNLRDLHMADTLDALLEHLGPRAGSPKLVVWAHNSHLGDARATEMGERGEHNLGQLMRQRHPGETCLIGFSTSLGTVTAASRWGGPAERKLLKPALPGSWEATLARVAVPKFIVRMDRLGDEARQALQEPRLQRAVGVLYLPHTERMSHYFHARLTEQFDAVIHLDRTRALEPLDRVASWDAGEQPETYPTGL